MAHLIKEIPARITFRKLKVAPGVTIEFGEAAFSAKGKVPDCYAVFLTKNNHTESYTLAGRIKSITPNSVDISIILGTTHENLVVVVVFFPDDTADYAFFTISSFTEKLVPVK